MEARISLVTLGVADLARATAFYERGLGLPLINDAAAEGVAFFQLEGLRLALYSRHALAEDAGLADSGPQPFSGIALAHNLGSPAEVDALLAHAARVGGRIVKPAHKVFWGGYSGYFADPDGHLWEVAWNPEYLPPA